MPSSLARRQARRHPAQPPGRRQWHVARYLRLQHPAGGMAHRESQPAFPHRGHSGQVGVTTRRDALFLLIAASLARPRPAQAADNVTPDIIGPRHGLSAFGDLKYPAGFAHFDYVNPAAPKGGELRAWQLDSFDNRSEEHTSELQSLMRISYAVFCSKKKNTTETN